MVAGGGGIRSFVSCRCLSAVTFLLSSCRRATSVIAARHFDLLAAVVSHGAGFTAKAFRETFSESLYRFFWPPWACLPSRRSPNRTFFRILQSGMGATWPAQRSCDFINIVGILGTPARVRTSVPGAFSLQLMPRSFLNLMVWKWLIFFFFFFLMFNVIWKKCVFFFLSKKWKTVEITY